MSHSFQYVENIKMHLNCNASKIGCPKIGLLFFNCATFCYTSFKNKLSFNVTNSVYIFYIIYLQSCVEAVSLSVEFH